MLEPVSVPQTLEQAEAFAALGVSVIPIAPKTKEPPLGFPWGTFTKRMADSSERYHWFGENGWQLGVVCGPISGNLVIIDFDRKQFDDGGYAKHAEQFPKIKRLPRVRTGSGKVHVYCRSDRPIVKYDVGVAPDRIEVRSGNHYCVAPSSIHPDTGKAYVWERLPKHGIPKINLEDIGFETREKRHEERDEPGIEGEPLDDAERDRIVEFMRPFWVEGQRHNLTLALAGYLAGQCVPERDVDEIISELSHNESDHERRDVRIAVRDTYRKWKQGIAVAGWSKLTDRNAPLISSSAAAQLELMLKGRIGTFTFVEAGEQDTENTYPYIIDVADLLNEPDEPEQWLVENVWRDATVGLIVGPPKTYKSFFAQELSVAIATGTPMFGMFDVPEPQCVVYIQEESARRFVRRRYAGILRGHGIHPEALRGQLYTITNQHFRLDDPVHVQRLIEEAIEAYEPALIILDPLREVHWQDENKAESMMPMLRTLKDLRDVYGISIAIVHHNNKNPEYTNPAESIRGSTAIWAAMDAGIFIQTTDTENRMKVNLTLKEGGQVDPFLYSVISEEGSIKFEIVELDGSKRPSKATVNDLVQWAWGRRDWWTVEDAMSALPVADSKTRRLIRDAVRTQQIQEMTGPKNRKMYAHPEVSNDEPTF